MIYVSVFILLGSCKQQENIAAVEEKAEVFFSVDSIPKPKELNEEEFIGLENTFESLYRVANREDLVLVIEDLIEKQKTLEASTYPATFDIPQIKSRQKVFKTYILKTKGNLEYRDGTKGSTIEMIEAYNAFRNQFNVIVNSRLDTLLIFSE